jgi:hypothetical protein
MQVAIGQFPSCDRAVIDQHLGDEGAAGFGQRAGLDHQQQRLGHHRCVFAVGDQPLRLAVVHLPGQQRRVEPRIQRVQHGIQCRHGIVRLDHLGRIRQHDGNGVILAKAQTRERTGQSTTTLFGITPVTPHVPINHRQPVAINLRRATDEIQWRQRCEINIAALKTFIKIRHVDLLPEVTIALF